MFNLSDGEFLLVRIGTALLVSIAIFGTLSNFCLFYVTLRHKTLRSTCHLLIGLCAFLDTIHQTGQFHQIPLLFSDGMMDSSTCSVLEILPEVCLLSGCACVLCIGLERLTAVVFLSQYRALGHRILHAHLLFMSCFGAYAVYLIVAYYEPKRQICNIPAPFHGVAADLWAQAMAGLNLSAVIVYCSVAVVISLRAEVSAATRKSFRSIFFVMTADVSGWAVTIVLTLISLAIDISAERRFTMHIFAALFVNAGIATKAIIYFATSTEYRQAYRAVFGKYFPPKVGTATVAAATSYTTHFSGSSFVK